MERSELRRGEVMDTTPEEVIPEASRSFKTVQLQLLMKEREEAAAKLVELDYTIWVLEEYFRGGSP